MTALTDMADLSVEDGIAIITIDNPPVNALSQGVRQGIKDGIAQCLADNKVDAVVLICAGRTFIAGADITEFGGPPKEPGLHSTLNDMENSSKPIIAAIHGTALGGGLEAALVCHFRVSDAGARFGLPEVNLGLLPGAGGTQRLPRVVGAEKALQMMTSGVPIGAMEALEHGLVEEIVAGDLREGAIAFAHRVVDEGIPLAKIRDRDDKLQSARDNPDLFDNFREGIARKTRGFLADGGLDYLNEAPGLVVVEWADRVSNLLPETTLWLRMGMPDTGRKVVISGPVASFRWLDTLPESFS